MHRLLLRVALSLGCWMFMAEVQTLAQAAEASRKTRLAQAIQLIDKGDYDLATGLLRALEKEDPNTYLYTYELGYIHALRKEYALALATTDRILNKPDITSQVYQMRGNCRSAMGDKDQAIEEYDKGLALFPNAGNLYLEKGNVFLQQKKYEEAAVWYRAGIKAEPMFASNYYRLSRLYLGSKDALTGMVLGELCMNLDKNSRRSLELAKLVFQAYQQSIQLTPQGPRLSFCEIYLDAEKMQQEGYQLPLCAVFGNCMAKALQGIQTLDFGQFIQVRERFIQEYYTTGKGQPGNVLMEYLWKVHRAGHWEAYHWHLFQLVDASGFEQWKLQHTAAYNAFLQWEGAAEHRLLVDQNNCFTQ